MVSASGSETSVLSSIPTSAIIYDAYTSINFYKKKVKKKKKNSKYVSQSHNNFQIMIN